MNTTGNHMHTDFATAGRVLFGWGKIYQLAELISAWGKNAFLVRGKSKSYGQPFYAELEKAGVNITEYSVSSEPEANTISEAVSLARNKGCEFVIAFGGGSVIDTGKAVSALLTNEGDLLDYLEVIGKGLPLKYPSAHFIAMPTTSGTGSEVTKNAVINVPEKKVKVSIRSNFLLPSIALVDPQFTTKLPAEITASSGMDAFIQVIEPYVCNAPNAMVDMFCKDAIPRAASALPRAYKNGRDIEARINMSWVSLMGGLSLANAKLGAVHGFAGPIGGMYHSPHGAICAALLTAVIKVNCELLAKSSDGDVILKRYIEVFRWVTGSEHASIKDGIQWFDELCKALNIQPLRKFGVQRSDFEEIIEKSSRSSSMRGNPVQLGAREMSRILEMAY